MPVENTDKKALIFDIKEFSVHDGPGIRTTIFFKGCPLRCLWCQNPEGFKLKKEIYYFSSKCINCGSCIKVCPNNALRLSPEGWLKIDREKCSLCGECVSVCPTGAISFNGEWVSISKLVELTLRNLQFYKDSGGGVTLSGGEPTMQVEAAESLLKELKKRNIHTAIETCGCTKEEDFLRVLNYTDLVIFDLKVANKKLHQKFTGASNEVILKNLRRISGKDLLIRIPIIPGYTDTEENLISLSKIISKLNKVRGVELVPYNELAETKYIPDNTRKYKLKGLKTVSREHLRHLKRFFSKFETLILD